MAPLSKGDILDLITHSRFLAHSQISSLYTSTSIDVIILCGNAIVPIAEHVFSALEEQPSLIKTLLICGGIGHSTQLLYEAFRRNRKYSDLADRVNGLPEAGVYELMLRKYYPRLAERVDKGE